MHRSKKRSLKSGVGQHRLSEFSRRAASTQQTDIKRDDFGGGSAQHQNCKPRLGLTFSDGHMHHKLALRRMTGNVSLTRRILGYHDAPGRESTDVAIARLKLNLTR